LHSFSQKQLYVKGCRILCEEQSRADEVQKEFTPSLPTNVFKIATHIAAATILCQRTRSGWRQIAAIPGIRRDLRRVVRGAFLRNGVSLTRENVKETLNTALFCARDGNRLGWAHQTYANFFAAQYLHTASCRLRKCSNCWFILEIRRESCSALHETAAGLATMDDSIREAIFKTEPEYCCAATFLPLAMKTGKGSWSVC